MGFSKLRGIFEDVHETDFTENTVFIEVSAL